MLLLFQNWQSYWYCLRLHVQCTVLGLLQPYSMTYIICCDMYIVDGKLHLTCSNCVTWHQAQSQVYIDTTCTCTCFHFDWSCVTSWSLCVMNDYHCLELIPFCLVLNAVFNACKFHRSNPHVFVIILCRYWGLLQTNFVYLLARLTPAKAGVASQYWVETSQRWGKRSLCKPEWDVRFIASCIHTFWNISFWKRLIIFEDMSVG